MRRDLPDELRAMLDDDDPRTVEEMRDAEPSYTFTVERIDGRNDTHTFVYIGDDSLCGGFNRPDVKVGDTITVWDGYAEPMIGGQKHGWALNGEVVEWKTPFERVAERIAWLAKYDREKRERFEKEKAELDAKYEALPEPLKARIDRFRAESPKFRVDSEAYEMFAVVDAAKIADHLRPRVEDGEDPQEVVKEFYDLSWDEQQAVGLSAGHSGNTFGGACSLARALLAGEAV